MLKYLENVMCHECTIKTLEIFFKSWFNYECIESLNHNLIYSQHGQLFEVTNGQFCYNVLRWLYVLAYFKYQNRNTQLKPNSLFKVGPGLLYL